MFFSLSNISLCGQQIWYALMACLKADEKLGRISHQDPGQKKTLASANTEPNTTNSLPKKL
jgi:hypothetical protein